MSADTISAGERAAALLVTADGAVFAGEAAGAAHPIATGELVFNTAMSGYQEVISDPSYAGQVVAFTNTHIGNYGTNGEDDEATEPYCRGVVVRDLTVVPSNWRATEGLESFLVRHGLPAITGVDTRRLTRHLRQVGAVPCAFGTAERGRAPHRGRHGRHHRRDGPGLRGHGEDGDHLRGRAACASWPSISA